MGNRHRYMYYMTGLPGWMRFGYSPGWIGRSPTGLPPAAQYLAQTGHVPQFASYLQQQAPLTVAPVTPPVTPPLVPTMMPGTPTPVLKEQEIAMLEMQAKTLGQQLEQIKKRLEELGK